MLREEERTGKSLIAPLLFVLFCFPSKESAVASLSLFPEILLLFFFLSDLCLHLFKERQLIIAPLK